MKHKHAEVLIAIAEGRDVEYKPAADSDWLEPSDRWNPLMEPDFEWRVKAVMDDVIDDAWLAYNLKSEIKGSCAAFKAGFLAGVQACQNGEYY